MESCGVQRAREGESAGEKVELQVSAASLRCEHWEHQKKQPPRQIDVCSSHSSAILGRDLSQSSEAQRPAQESASCFHMDKGQTASQEHCR